ncbi:predicted protein [Verticillium alfalfae VaMs.102]|uniref:Predicted protein n=1 Tax=Verticillium alfalfae (strain VaMs.102 / ATCC MYA-4576 / FGSC 10136) TaxID=526221 RepID=C9S5B0_VERA1|nr:predicted protein [Verticillium alfalfae VaMs.102]EEY15018.1 predicted protein [Verticillium alfalfae VaMs.102]
MKAQAWLDLSAYQFRRSSKLSLPHRADARCMDQQSPGHFHCYLLNPGDMFQVDVERVLYATGKPKNPQEIARLDKLLREREEREAAAEAKDAALRAAKRQELADKLKAGDRGGGEGPSAEALRAGPQAIRLSRQSRKPSVEAAATDADAAGMLGEDGEPMTEGRAAPLQHKRQLKKLIQDAKNAASRTARTR